MRNEFVNFQNRNIVLQQNIRTISWSKRTFMNSLKSTNVCSTTLCRRKGINVQDETRSICDFRLESWTELLMILCEQYIPLKVEHYQLRGPLTEYSSYNSTFNIPNSTVLQWIKWASEHFFKSRLLCLEKRIWISYRHSRRSQSSASLRSATPSCSCRPLYLRFSRTDLLTMTSTFQKGFRSRLSLNCWPTFRF